MFGVWSTEFEREIPLCNFESIFRERGSWKKGAFWRVRHTAEDERSVYNLNVVVETCGICFELLWLYVTVDSDNTTTSSSLLKFSFRLHQFVFSSRPRQQSTSYPAISESVLKLPCRRQVVPAEASGTTQPGHPRQTKDLGRVVLKVLSSPSYTTDNLITNSSTFRTTTHFCPPT